MRPVVLLLLVMFIQPLVDACPTNGTLLALCQCDDSHGGVLLNCSGRDAATVIAALRDNRAQLGLIQQLSLQHSNMRELSANFLAGLYVKKLDFSHNLLTHIDASAFRGLQTVLQDFVAHHNQLYRVPADALNGISSLLNLDLSNNSIGDLDVTQAFVNVPKLFHINLASNNICAIHQSVFDSVKSQLQSLNLGHNCLIAVPAQALRNHKQLLALHLHSNHIERLDALAFVNLPVMNLLNLANNRIESIHRQAFLNVPNLRYLYLSSNRLFELGANQFRHLATLEMIDLTGNRIQTIPADAFADMPRLVQLYMGDNHIAQIESGAFRNSSLIVLMLPSNRFTQLSADMFNGLGSLQQLGLKDNQIISIDQNTFYNVPSLVMLDLSHNHLLDLPPATFLAQLNMFLVDLSSNQLLRTPYGAFNKRVMTVVLQENPLVCTERVHMLQQGVGVYVPGAVDHVCNSPANPINGLAPSPLDAVQIDTVGNDSSSIPNAFVQDTAPPVAPYSIIRPIAANETEPPLRSISRIQIGQGQLQTAPPSTLNQLPTTPAPASVDNDNNLLLPDDDDDLADQQSPVATTVANAPPRTILPFPVPFLSQGPKMYPAFAVTRPLPRTLPPSIVLAVDDHSRFGEVVVNPIDETILDESSPERTNSAPVDIAVGETFPYESTDRTGRHPAASSSTNATVTIVVCLSAVGIVMLAVFISLCVIRHRSTSGARIGGVTDGTVGSSASNASSSAARTSAYVAAQASMAYSTLGRSRPASSLTHHQHPAATWIYAPGSFSSASNYYK